LPSPRNPFSVNRSNRHTGLISELFVNSSVSVRGYFEIGIPGPIARLPSCACEPKVRCAFVVRSLPGFESSRRSVGAAVHSSSLIPHRSFLIAHSSSLIPHRSFLIAHPSSLIPHYSLLIIPIPHSSFLIAHSSSLIAHSSSLIPHPSSLITHYPHSSSLIPHPSLSPFLIPHYSLLIIPIPHPSLLITHYSL
jgi:hypothetical protein